ncbi:MAG: riboflavin kinase, partial [Erythrobacteraceae bacterium]
GWSDREALAAVAAQCDVVTWEFENVPLAPVAAIPPAQRTRPVAIRGIVEHGDKRGRTIGYPTANVTIDNYLRPKYGIYAVTGRLLATGQVLHGAANIGIRPQFEPPKELLEPYFFDFSGDLYGQEIEVAFHHFLRGEAKFDGLEALIEQMDKDCAEARRLLSAQPL